VIAQIFYESTFEKLQVENIGQFHLIFSFVISILIAFRVNVSYSRWWEGRTYWGNLVNNSRNIALKFNNFIGLKNEPIFIKYLCTFPQIFKFHLRGQIDTPECQELIKQLDLPVKENDHIPNSIINQMYKIINSYRLAGKISLEQYLSMDVHLANIIDLAGGCEKIVSTPIPTPFKIFIRQALLFYMVIFPFGWVEKFGFLIIPMIIVIVDVLLGLELISEEIETPFAGSDVKDGELHDNTLDLNGISQKIALNVQSIANS
ncbi:MAG TPA: bestrophin family ion channel, partial [Aquella sp.]|nr:bestrophin family ion channel [Aquella sp.]